MSNKHRSYRNNGHDPHHRRGGPIKSSDPPQDAMEPSSPQAQHEQRDQPSFGRRLARIGRDIYMLGQYPWVYVILILSYFVVSVAWLIEKASAFNILSVSLSLFVLTYAVIHNLVELVECLGVIFRHVGFAFKFMGRAFTETGQLFRRTAKRLRETLVDVRHVQ